MWKWAAIIVLGRGRVGGVDEVLLGLFTHLIFTGILGAVFIYMLKSVTSRLIYFKGWLFAVVAWFAIYASTLFYEVEGLFPVATRTAFSNLSSASVYGITLAWFINRTYHQLQTPE
jgi:hypothetical protein